MSSNKASELLKTASAALRTLGEERDTLAQENQALTQKLAFITRRLEVEKLAADMHEKGLNSDVEFVQLVHDLEKKAEDGRLEAIKEAVAMTGPDMGSRLRINNDETRVPGKSAFEAFIVS